MFSWQFFILLLAASITMPLAIMIWRNWDMLTARPLAAALMLCSGWCLAVALEISTDSLTEKHFLFEVRLSFIPFIPPLLLEAYYRYAKGRKLLVGWKLFAILIIPVTSAILVWLPDEIFCYDFHLGQTGAFSTLLFTRGPANIVYFSYCTAIAACAVILMFATWAQSPPWMRRGSLLFVIIYLIPATTDFLFVTGWSPTPGFNYTPVLFAFTSSVLAWILFGERIMSLGPVARSALIEHLKEPLIVLDSRHHVIDANAATARLLGTTTQKIYSRPASFILSAWPEVLALLDQGTVENREVRSASDPGTWECSVYPVPENGAPHAQLILLRNTTERKEIEAELHRAKDAAESSNLAKSAFLAMISHEIRTPMGGVIGFAQMLEKTPLSPEQHEYTQMILVSGQAQLRIINDILDYSKVEAGRMDLEQRPFSLPSEIEKNCLLFVPQAEQKGLSLQWHIAPDVPAHVTGDSLRLGQVLINLIGNAIKFTSQGSISVQVEAETLVGDNALIRFTVKDTGIGIAQDAAERLFRSFSQIESSTARRFGGTGLGLAIARRLCLLMGGDITVQSKPGQGSTFVATLILRVAPPATSSPASQVSRDPHYRSLRVLVVEDNATNQRLVQVMLRKMGHTATVCGDGASALRALQHETFDAVFMDIEMPEMDGFETVSRIRALENRGDIASRNYIIALTAHAAPGDRDRFLAAGMDEYVSKPLMFPALEGALKRCV
jgi:signal transduction histidine kinase/ActR/RegA family two-component response regulator